MAFAVLVTGSNPAVVQVKGEVDLSSKPELLSALEALDGDVVLECSDVEFVDVAGARAFVAARAACEARGSSLLVIDPRGCVSRLLQLVGLDADFTIQRESDLW